MKKYRSLKITALLLSLLLILGVCPMAAFAEPTETAEPDLDPSIETAEVVQSVEDEDATASMEETVFTEVFSTLNPR